MKVLLLHPEDSFSAFVGSKRRWDLIVDLRRSPLSTYENWSREAGCKIISLYDFAEEREDRQRIRALLQLGMGEVVDRFGIDWWDISSLLIVDDLLQAIWLGRLAKELGVGCHVEVSRSSFFGEILRQRTGGTLRNLESRLQPITGRIRHYCQALAHLDTSQLIQVLQDKFDPEHSWRGKFAQRKQKSSVPVILLPSGYINVSRMAVAYAAMLPEKKFLLVCSRKIGWLNTLPANVEITSLDPYFVSNDKTEIDLLLRRWEALKIRLIAIAEEFADAEMNGALARIPVLIRSGIAVRNAWNQVFDWESVKGCLSTDDTVPDTRIPLILAKNRGVPAIACHHGALDQHMAIKKHHEDFYLAKGEMERDYLLRICNFPQEKLVMGGPAPAVDVVGSAPEASGSSWLVFFTEPYHSDGWRQEEVYRDLLPRLCSLAETCRLRLVFKLHPFESVKSIRRLLRKYLPPSQARAIHVFTGPISPQLWESTRFAMTVQSTVALSCHAQGIPVFLCSWLGNPYSGYLKHYSRFGIGHILDSAQQIAEIPRLLEKLDIKQSARGASWQVIKPERLAYLFRRTNCLSSEVGV